MNIFNSLFGAGQYAEGQGLRGITGALNSAGVHTPDFGISRGLINQGEDRMGTALPASNPFTANAMYGLNPTQDQQASIANNPGLSGPVVGNNTTRLGVFGPQQASSTYANFGSGGEMGSGNTARVVPPKYNFLAGKQYDITQPDQAKSYFQDKSNFADKKQQIDRGLLDTKYSQSLGEAASAHQLYGQQLDQSMNNIGNQETNYANDYNKRVDQFGHDYRTGSANRQNSFAALSPGVLQSAQGDEQGYADTMYGKGLNQLTRESGQQQQNFADSKSNLNLEKNNLMDTYNHYRTNAQTSYNQEAGNIDNYANEVKNSTAAEVAPYQARAGISNFADEFKNSGGLNTYDPNHVANTDMSKFNAATTFSGLGGQSTDSGAAGAGGNPFANMAPAQTNSLDSYLAQNAGNINADPMKKFLYGSKAGA